MSIIRCLRSSKGLRRAALCPLATTQPVRHFAREKLSLRMDDRQLDACPGNLRDIAYALVCFAFEVTGSSLRFRTALPPEDSGIIYDRIGKLLGLVVRGEFWRVWESLNRQGTACFPASSSRLGLFDRLEIRCHSGQRRCLPGLGCGCAQFQSYYFQRFCF